MWNYNCFCCLSRRRNNGFVYKSLLNVVQPYNWIGFVLIYKVRLIRLDLTRFYHRHGWYCLSYGCSWRGWYYHRCICILEVRNNWCMTVRKLHLNRLNNSNNIILHSKRFLPQTQEDPCTSFDVTRNCFDLQTLDHIFYIEMAFLLKNISCLSCVSFFTILCSIFHSG